VIPALLAALLAAGPGPAAEPAPPSLAQVAARLDTVHLAGGGRVRCLVVEEGPDGVVARLVDGAERTFAPGQVSRIDWADGTSSEVATTPLPDPPGRAGPPAGPGEPRVPHPPPPPRRVLRPLPPSSS
jgi:hypothetical protein